MGGGLVTDPIEALLAAERAAPLEGAAAAKQVVLANVLAHASAATVAGWSTQALVLAALVSGVTGAVAGGVVVHTLNDTARIAAPVEAPVTLPPTTPTEPDADESPVETPVAREPLDSDRTTRERVRAEPPTARRVVEPARPESTLRGERALIDQAASALRAGRPRDALVALMSHERQFPTGTLAEERDRLSVEALVGLGRTEQARQRAALFEQRHPQSPSRARVRTLVDGLGE